MEYRPNEDIFDMDAEVIVNPVNAKAHLLTDRPQEGLAGLFEKRFPAIQERFKQACADGDMTPGKVLMMGVKKSTGERAPRGESDLAIACIATKDHWAKPSRLEWVDRGLEKLAGAVEARGIKSVAIPMLGAGFGKLPWSQVRPLVEKHFKPLADKGVKVMVMGPGPQKQMESTNKSASSKEENAPSGNTAASDVKGTSNAPQTSHPEGSKFYAGIGARDTPEAVLAKMEKVGRILAKNGFILRSGAADGADSAFERGCDAIDPSKKEIFLPWNGFEPKRDGKKRFANGTTVFDFGSPEHEKLAEKYHPGWHKLGSGARALMSRNTSQMLGMDLKTPSAVVVCWTKNGEVVRGTGQALRMANDMKVGIVNMGDEKLKSMPAESIARIAMSVGSGKVIGKAVMEERMHRKRTEGMEM